MATFFYFLGQLFGGQLLELFARETNLKKQSSVHTVQTKSIHFFYMILRQICPIRQSMGILEIDFERMFQGILMLQ